MRPLLFIFLLLVTSPVYADDVWGFTTMLVSGTTDCWVSPKGGNFDCNTTLNAVRSLAGVAGNITWYAYSATDPGSGSVNVQLDLNGTPTGTCTLTGGGGAPVLCSQTTPVAMLITSLVAWKLDFTSWGGSTRISVFAVVDSTSTDEFAMMGSSRQNIGAFGQFGTLTGNRTTSATESAVYIVAPTAGTITAACAVVFTGTSAGDTRTFTVRVDGVDSANVVEISDPDGTTPECNLTDVSVDAGDTISITTSGTVSPTASIGAWCIVVTASGKAWMSGNTVSNLSAAANNFVSISGTDGGAGAQPTATENQVHWYVRDFLRITTVAAKLSAAPDNGGGANGDAYQFDLRKNSADAPDNMRFTISESSTFGSFTGSFYATTGNLLDIESAPAYTPTAASVAVSIAFEVVSGFPSNCSDDYIFIDFNQGTNGAVLTDAIVNTSVYGRSGGWVTVTAAGTSLTTATGAAMTLPGTLPTFCNVPYSGTPSSVGMNLNLNTTTERYFTFPALSGVSSAPYMIIGYETDIPGNTNPPTNHDLGAIFSTGSGYSNWNVNGNATTLRSGLESPANGGGCLASSPATNNTNISSNARYMHLVKYDSNTSNSVYVDVYGYTNGTLVDSLDSAACWNQAAGSFVIGFHGGGGGNSSDSFNIKIGWILICMFGTCDQSSLPITFGSTGRGGLLNLMMSPKTPRVKQ